MNYVIYDFETTGKEAKYDQPIQFAAALVDEKFNILETFNERCRLRDGVIPSPKALLITKAQIDSLKNEQSYYELMRKIYCKLQSWSPAIFFGFNNIVFDDELLRHNFYQSLLNPYITTSNENSRVDLWRITCALAPLELDIINIPKNSKTGKNTLSLVALSKENNIEHKLAHDALADVMATIGLAKIIQEKDSLFWETCLKVRSLKTCADFLKSEEYFFCAPQASSSLKYTPISLLTMNPAENKELAFFDLNHDPEQHLETRVSGITSLIQSKQRVIRIIKGNRFPIMLNKDYLKNVDCFKELANNTSFTERAKKIRSSENFIENVKQSLVDRWEEKQLVPSDNLEEQLYGGPRLNPDDQEKIKEFNDSTEPVAKLKASSKINDSRYKQHANRVMYEEYPDELTIRQKQKHQKIIAEKALSENKNVKWMTIPKAKRILASVKEDERYQKQKDYIGQIEEYIKLEEKKYKKYCN